MKTLLYTLLFILPINLDYLHAQSKPDLTSDNDRIVLASFIPDYVLKDSPSSKKLFKSKLNQIASRNGLTGSKNSSDSRFIISGDVNIITSDILPTAPPKYSMLIEVNLAIGDGVEGVTYSNKTIELKGVGVSEDKAFMSAIKKIRPNNSKLKDLVEEGKNKIVDYYNLQCNFIHSQADLLSSSRSFEEAIYLLSHVPKVAKNCYDSSMELAKDILKDKYEFDCQKNISLSKSMISKGEFTKASDLLFFYSKEMDCYTEVSDLLIQIENGMCSHHLGKARAFWSNRDSKNAAASLSNISSASSCHLESIRLADEIGAYLDSTSKMNWELDLKIYSDQQKIRNRELDNKALEIEAIRKIGVAYGENQPRKISYKSILN